MNFRKIVIACILFLMLFMGIADVLKFDVPFQSQGEPIVQKHLTHAFYPFFDNWPKNTMQKIIKIVLPWYARIPKGYKLLQTHPFLLDDNRFTTMSGVLDPELGPANVGTIPMFWHTTNDDEEIILKAGTPLAQYILIPKEEPDFTQIEVNDDKKFQKDGNYEIRNSQFFVDDLEIPEFQKKLKKVGT